MEKTQSEEIWNITSKYLKREYDLNCFDNGRRTKFFENGRQMDEVSDKIMEPATIEVKTMLMALLLVTYFAFY